MTESLPRSAPEIFVNENQSKLGDQKGALLQLFMDHHCINRIATTTKRLRDNSSDSPNE